MKRVLGISGLCAVLLAVIPGELWAQMLPPDLKGICRVTLTGWNKDRKVKGDLRVECGDEGWPIQHSAPWGNWGVSSIFGGAIDGHQFDGWCKDRWVCDNYGDCKCDCLSDLSQQAQKERWYQWNGCTAEPRWAPENCSLYNSPDCITSNCTLYNSPDCTTQESTTGINELGTVSIDIPVDCPHSSTEKGGEPCDRGGCKDLSFGPTGLDVWELDFDGNDLAEKLLFPAVTFTTSACDIWTCGNAVTKWVSPISPIPSRRRVDAKFRVQMKSGEFRDSNDNCGQAGTPYGDEYDKYNCLR